MNYYTGDAKCAGCGKTGREVSRDYKDSLCSNCKRLLALGRAKDIELKVEYANIKQHYHAYSSSRVNDFVHDMLTMLNNPTAPANTPYFSFKSTFGDNCQCYRIDVKLVEPLKKFFHELDSYCNELKDAYNRMDKDAEQAVKEVKDRIYNEGVAKGRELLRQLNSGEITLDDFSKPVKRY